MRYLMQGMETGERLNLLLSLTNIRSENVIDALHDHLVKGLADSTAAAINGCTQSNFKRALDAVEAVAATVEQIKQLDWKSVK